MKRAILTSLFILALAGCHRDPQPPIFRAKASAVANNVCVQVQPEGDERVVVVRIEEPGNDAKMFAKYDITDVPASPEKCVPTYGYKFEAGHSYNFTVYLESDKKKAKAVIPASRIFTVGFTVKNNNGKLQLLDFN